MRLDQIQKRTLITEGWNDSRLTLLETQHIIPFVSNIEKYITEANLNPQQISQLFTDVEKGATTAGGNRTLVGKGKDAASFINKKIDELGAQLKKAGPVQNADAKFDQLKSKIGAKDGKVVKAIQGVSDWAKENPGKASIAVGILTTAAAMAGGPLGGAVAGFVARATKDLLQGSDLSTAVGKAAKTGVIGALVGFGVEKIGDMIGSALAWGNDTINPSYMTATWDYSESNSGTFNDWASAKLIGYPDDIGPIRDMWTDATDALSANDYDKFNSVWPNIEAAVDEINTPEYFASLDGTDKARATWQSGMQAFSKMMDGVAAGAQGAAQAGDDKKETTQFNSIQIETIIEWCDDTPAVILTEGPMDALKKAGSTVGGALKKGAKAVGAKAAKVGKNMTTKVTADKLNKAWTAAGKPTDSDAIANILRQQGVDDKVLAPVYKTLGAKLPPAPVASQPKGAQPKGATPVAPQPKGAAPVMDFKAIQQAVAKLSPQDAKALVTHIDSLSKAPGPKKVNATPVADPATQDATAAPTAPKPAPTSPALSSYFQNFSKAMKGASDKNQKISLAKELVNTVADRGGEDSETAVSVLRKFGGDLDNNFKQAAMNALKTGQRLLKQSVYYEINKMLKEHDLSWSDLGMRVHLLEGTNKMFGISLI
jgi:hypothetical protein